MFRPVPPADRRRAAAAAALLFAAVWIAGCTAGPAPTASAPTASAATASAPTAQTSPAASASPTQSVAASPATPTLRLDGTAADNLAFFRAVAEPVWNSPNSVSGRAYVDALVSAGFDRAAMQVTNDTTTIGDPAESIQFSVLWRDGQCLVGQAGPATGTLVTAVLPAVGGGVCLLGETRPIDW